MEKNVRKIIRGRNRKRAADVDRSNEGKVRIYFANDVTMTFKQFAKEIGDSLGLSLEDMKNQLN